MNDMPTLCNEVVRVARKQHVCYECRGLILPGENYYYYSGIWDSHPESYKRCSDCVALINSREAELRLLGIPADEMIFFGGLWEELDASDDKERMKKFKEIQTKRNPAAGGKEQA